MQLIIVSAAAKHLVSKSHSELYKLINDGWLDAHAHAQIPSGQRLPDVERMQKSLQDFFQWYVDGFRLRKTLWCWVLYFSLYRHKSSRSNSCGGSL